MLAVPDLAEGVAWFHQLTGVRPIVGGSHVGLGTANHLVGLGGRAYLEIIGPDPDQPDPSRPRPFGLDGLTAAGIVAWCVRPPDIDRAVATARARGYDPGTPTSMSRHTSDGTLLTWRVTSLPTDPADGIVPFLIDWGTSPHPAMSAMPILRLRSLEAEHPEPAHAEARLAALDVALTVRLGERPRLLANLHGIDGPIALG